jgi:hypothetical protein
LLLLQLLFFLFHMTVFMAFAFMIADQRKPFHSDSYSIAATALSLAVIPNTCQLLLKEISQIRSYGLVSYFTADNWNIVDILMDTSILATCVSFWCNDLDIASR